MKRLIILLAMLPMLFTAKAADITVGSRSANRRLLAHSTARI